MVDCIAQKIPVLVPLLIIMAILHMHVGRCRQVPNEAVKTMTTVMAMTKMKTIHDDNNAHAISGGRMWQMDLAGSGMDWW